MCVNFSYNIPPQATKFCTQDNKENLPKRLYMFFFFFGLQMKLFCCTPSQLGVLFMVKRPGASSH